MNGTYHCNGTRRFLLRTTLVCILSLGLLLPACARHQGQERERDGLELVILHVNDTHAHVAGIDKYGNAAFSEAESRGGYGRIAEAVRRARSVDGVDVIVGGHTHSYLGPDSEEGPYPVVEHSPSGQPVLVVTAKRATQYLGELKVDFDGEGVPVSWSGGLRELEKEDPTMPAVSALIDKYTATLESFRSDVVGSGASGSMPDGMDACREGDCLGGMVTVDAMLSFARPYGAVIAVCNGGAIRASLPEGRITRGDLLTIHPFGNMMVIREYSGEQLWEALEHGVSAEGAGGPRLLQVAGLRYTVDGRRPAGSRVLRVDVVDEKGGVTPLDLKARYGVIVPSYLAEGGDGYEVLKEGSVLPSPDPIDVDVVEAYLRAHDPLPLPEGGRILHVGQSR